MRPENPQRGLEAAGTDAEQNSDRKDQQDPGEAERRLSRGAFALRRKELMPLQLRWCGDRWPIGQVSDTAAATVVCWASTD